MLQSFGVLRLWSARAETAARAVRGQGAVHMQDWPRGEHLSLATCLTQGKQGMDEQERAVAIRALLVSTARESADLALVKAMDDIERFRRAPRYA